MISKFLNLKEAILIHGYTRHRLISIKTWDAFLRVHLDGCLIPSGHLPGLGQGWTHKIDGLTESDFVFAAKVEDLQIKSRLKSEK